MRKSEIEEILKSLNKKFDAFGDIQTKAGEVESILNRAKEVVNLIDQDKNSTSQNKAEIVAITEEVKSVKPQIEEATVILNAYKTSAESNLAEFNSLKTKLNKLLKENDSLQQTVLTQLGVVSTKVLSNSFDSQTAKLQESIDRWFWWLMGTTIFLIVTAIVIVLWQLSQNSSVVSANFLIKITLTSPIIFFLIFITNQYRGDKKLLNEYTFKSTVALSFDAYRRLIKEEKIKQVDNIKVLEFIMSTVNNIYTSPMENLKKHKIDDEIDLLGKLLDVVKKFVK